MRWHLCRFLLAHHGRTVDVKATSDDDHLHEEDFDNGTVDVCTVGVRAEAPTVRFDWKTSSHSLLQRGAKAPSVLHPLPCSQPSRSTLCLTKVSLSFSRRRRPGSRCRTRINCERDICFSFSYREFEYVDVEWTCAKGHSPRGGVDLTHQHFITDKYHVVLTLSLSHHCLWWRSFTQSFEMAITFSQCMQAMQHQLLQLHQLRQQPHQQHCVTCHDGPKLQPSSAAQRRRKRRLRAAWRHEQQSIAQAVAAATHRSAIRRPIATAIWRLKTPPLSFELSFQEENELGSTRPDQLSLVWPQEAPPHPRPSASPEVAPVPQLAAQGVDGSHPLSWLPEESPVCHEE